MAPTFLHGQLAGRAARHLSAPRREGGGSPEHGAAEVGGSRAGAASVDLRMHPLQGASPVCPPLRGGVQVAAPASTPPPLSSSLSTRGRARPPSPAPAHTPTPNLAHVWRADDPPDPPGAQLPRPLFRLNHLQYYHENLDMRCPLIPLTGLPWCPVIQGDQILRAQATISNISMVVDQVCALNCTVLGSNPRLRPVHYQEVCSRPLKYARDFIFDPFLRFFSVRLSRLCPEESVTRYPWCPVY